MKEKILTIIFQECAFGEIAFNKTIQFHISTDELTPTRARQIKAYLNDKNKTLNNMLLNSRINVDFRVSCSAIQDREDFEAENIMLLLNDKKEHPISNFRWLKHVISSQVNAVDKILTDAVTSSKENKNKQTQTTRTASDCSSPINDMKLNEKELKLGK